jgi:DNA-nicking Smr family endonuclease
MNSKKNTFTVRPFEKLKKSIARNAAAAPPPPEARKKTEQYTDDELFQNAMDDVQVIEAFRALSVLQHHRKQQPAAERVDPDREVLATLDGIASGHIPINLPDTQEYVEWVNPEHQDTVIARLHQGRFSVQSFLDLHGFTAPEAEEELEEFLRDAFLKGFGCVKIIHGRGLRSQRGPRLKELVTRRLSGRHRKHIIAYVSARQCDGGLGAIYVLLARRE